MRRLIFLIAIAFMITGGTVGILFQEGVGGMPKDGSVNEATSPDTEDTDASYDETSSDEADTSDADETSDEGDYADVDADTDEEASSDSGVTALKPNSALEDEDSEDTETAVDEDTSAGDDEAAAGETGETEKAREAKEAKEAKEARGPFYSVRVIGVNSGGLTMHRTSSGDGDSLGTAAKDATGYLIGQDPKSGTRRLCYIDGRIAYLSKSYTEITEIAADEYPDALLSVTESDAGSDVSL